MSDFYGWMNTPVGLLIVEANDDGVTKVEFEAPEPVDVLPEAKPNPVVELALQQLEEYFAGKRQQFDLPLAAKGTEFRQQVWGALLDIPYGDTTSYSDIAHTLNNHKAVRAVGAANGANPIAIVVPCHRVIGKNGTLTGYAGGLNRKAWLLDFERERRQ